jgi:crossover junction endodeoxyribonuclease RuvC
VSSILAVDPGISGAIAFMFSEAPGHVASEDMPVADGDVDAVTLANRIVAMGPSLAIVEKVGAMPKQGVASTFRFGRAFGTVIGVIGALKVPLIFVAPTKWKAHFRLSADKEQARALALRLFPTSAEQFQRKRDHNRAEASLIALYALQSERRSHDGTQPLRR